MCLSAQAGGGAFGADRSPQCIADGVGFPFFGSDAQHPFGRAEHRDREGKGILRDGGQIWKMAFVDLLLAARFIQLDELDTMRVLEIGDWRIVESEMTILADAETAEINWLRLQ